MCCRSSTEAAQFVRGLTLLLRTLGTCRAYMEDGSLRCDVNVSVRSHDGRVVGERVEIKNLNSLRSLVRAVEHEITRQIGVYEQGGVVERETRAFDAKNGHTVLLRSKANMLDYRFMPEPDLPPLFLQQAFIDNIRAQLPELPHQQYHRLTSVLGLQPYDAHVLVQAPYAVAYFDRVLYDVDEDVSSSWNVLSNPSLPLKRPAKLVAKWLMNEVLGRLNRQHQEAAAMRHDPQAEDGQDDSEEQGSADPGSRGPSLRDCPVRPIILGQLLNLLTGQQISGMVAKQVLLHYFEHETETRSPKQVVVDNGWIQSSDQQLTV